MKKTIERDAVGAFAMWGLATFLELLFKDPQIKPGPQPKPVQQLEEPFTDYVEIK